MSTIDRRRKEDLNAWNFALSAFFLIILVIALWEIWGERGAFPHRIPVFDMILMALAAMRITRLVVYDKITRWFRELFVQKREVREGGETWIEIEPYRGGLMRSLHDLVQCPWCIGFWSSLMLVFCYYLFPWAWILMLFLAVSAVGTFLQILANMIGWKAEALKLEAKTRESK